MLLFKLGIFAVDLCESRVCTTENLFKSFGGVEIQHLREVN